MSNKIYVMDTSVLINDPQFYQHYPKSNIIIPIAVLNELDKLKKLANDAGRNARLSIRMLDDISDKGDIINGVLLENGAIISIDAKPYDLLKEDGPPDYGDTQILACAYNNWLINKNLILLSNDINLRVKAKAKGMGARTHKAEDRTFNDVYCGVQTIINEDAGGAAVCEGIIDPTEYKMELSPNEFAILKDNDGKDIISGRLVSENEFKPIKKIYPWKLSPRSLEQSMAIDLMMDSNIDLVTLTGPSGTGKSLVALACCLELLINKKAYDKLIIYRPIVSVGAELGYMPGELSDKLNPYFQAIFDSFEVLFASKSGGWKTSLDMYIDKGKIELGAISFIRGRSIPNSLMLIDEAQNIPADQIKTILTRAGENTRIFITGDFSQIDNNNLNASDNGLVHVIEKFKPSYLSGQINLVNGERSRLATESARIL